MKEKVWIHKSYFYKFLAYFLMTLIIPVITIIVLFFQAERKVADEIIISNQNTLEQFFNVIDATAEEVKETCISMAYNETCSTYAGYSVYLPDKATYKVYEQKEILNNFMREKYYDVFAYFPNEDRIVSGANSSMSSKYYYETYYKKNGENNQLEAFMNILNTNEKRPTLHVLRQDQKTPYLCVSMKQLNFQDQRLSYSVVIVLRPEYLGELMNGPQADSGSVMMMLNNAGKMLVNSRDTELSIDMNEHLDKKNWFEAELEDEKYIVSLRKSQVLDIYYASAVPNSYFMDQLWNLRLFSALGIIACTLVSILAAYWGTRRVYKPIGDMVTSLEKQLDVQYNDRSINEMEFISGLFQRESKENHALTRRLKEGKTTERFLISLLEGSVSGDIAGDDVFRKNGMSLCSDLFQIGVMLADAGENLDKEQETFIIKNVFNEICGRENLGYVIPAAGKRYILFLNRKESVEDEESELLFQEGQQFLQQYFNMKITIGLSRIKEGMRGIHLAYEEAVEALQYEYLLGKGSIIRYSRIRDREFYYPSSAEAKLSQMIRGYLNKDFGDMAVAELVDQIMNLHGVDKKASLKTVECFKFDVVNTLNKIMMTSGSSAEARQKEITTLMDKPTLKEFQEYLIYIIGTLYQQEQEKSQQGDICEQVKEYIKTHYANPELNVSLLGEEFHLSASYLSRLFKEKYENSILDYIAKVRIKNAKEDLKNTSKNVYEIAMDNGFLSSNVFIKTFKKWEGITPGVYRNLL